MSNTYTPNVQLAMPASGDRTWNVALNANSSALDVLAPVGSLAVTTTEGHFVTPTVIGRRLTLNPLLVFLALAFWTWMWGPIGAFLAVPLSIVALVVFNHLFPTDDVRLPD